LFHGDKSWTSAIKQSKYREKVMGMNTGFIWDIILLDEDFKYGDGTIFWGYVRTNTEPLCVEFCNFAQCHILMNYFKFLGLPSGFLPNSTPTKISYRPTFILRVLHNLPISFSAI
jgi:hypothetical protein